MRAARTVFCWLLWIHAFVCVQAAAAVLSALLAQRTLYGISHLEAILGLMAVTCALSAITAWRLRTGPTRWLWAALAANFITLPFGPFIALFGLVLLSRRAFHQHAPIAVEESAPHDGTNKWTRLLAAWGPFILLWPITRLNWNWAASVGLPDQSALAWIFWSELAFFTCTAMHEGGHWFCGWISDYTLLAFQVGPLHFKKSGGHWRFHFQPKHVLSLEGASGLIPKHLRRMRSRALFLTAGGPIGSLFAALTATVFFYSCANTPFRFLWPYLATVMAIGWLQFASSLIPVRSGNYYSDGARLLQYGRPGWSDQLLARSMAGLSLQTDLRPRDWHTQLIERAARFDNGAQERVPFLVYAAEMHEDRGNPLDAARWMQQAIDLCDAASPTLPWRKEFALTFAFHEAYHRGNATSARLWFNRAPKPRTPKDAQPAWHLAQAAVLMLEGDSSTARAAWLAAGEASRRTPKAGTYARERDQVDAMGKRWFATTPTLKAAA